MERSFRRRHTERGRFERDIQREVVSRETYRERSFRERHTERGRLERGKKNRFDTTHNGFRFDLYHAVSA